MLPSLLSNRKKSTASEGKTTKSGLQDASLKNYYEALSEEKELAQVVGNTFVINQPLDVVGGDGYWSSVKQDKPILAVFDCMGHGRLASIMTRLYIDTLEKVTDEIDILDPAEILQRVHEKVGEEFNRSSDSQIGTAADLAIVVLDTERQTMQYSGAKMHLLRLDDGEAKVYKAHKRSVGTRYEYEREYETCIIPYDAQTKFYLYSDGVTDLFGGPEEKKLGSKRLLEMIKGCFSLDLTRERVCLSEKLNRWSGNATRLDDLLLIGFMPGVSFTEE
ncbi:MAG: SpoIIE family protein phosphatase [Bacteroidota bacterium]